MKGHSILCGCIDCTIEGYKKQLSRKQTEIDIVTARVEKLKRIKADIEIVKARIESKSLSTNTY